MDSQFVPEGVSEGPWEAPNSGVANWGIYGPNDTLVADTDGPANAAFIAHTRLAYPEACALLERLADSAPSGHQPLALLSRRLVNCNDEDRAELESMHAARAFLAAAREFAKKGATA